MKTWRTDSFGCAAESAPPRHGCSLFYDSRPPRRTTGQCLHCCPLISGLKLFDGSVRWLTAKNPLPMTITMIANASTLQKEAEVFFQKYRYMTSISLGVTSQTTPIWLIDNIRLWSFPLSARPPFLLVKLSWRQGKTVWNRQCWVFNWEKLWKGLLWRTCDVNNRRCA
jgi:hypothetical protein